MGEAIKKWWKELICDHDWAKRRGFGDPIDGSPCLKCTKIYHIY